MTAPGILCNTDHEAFTEALTCMNADKEVQRSIVVSLIDIPYEFVEVESAEEAAERLEREKVNLQKLLDEALKAQGAVSKPPDWSDGPAGSSRCCGWLSHVACIRGNRPLLAVACRLCPGCTM